MGPNVQIRMILLDQLGYDIKDLDKLAREAGVLIQGKVS